MKRLYQILRTLIAGSERAWAYKEFNIGNGERMVDRAIELGHEGWTFTSMRIEDKDVYVKCYKTVTVMEAYRNGYEVR